MMMMIIRKMSCIHDRGYQIESIDINSICRIELNRTEYIHRQIDPNHKLTDQLAGCDWLYVSVHTVLDIYACSIQCTKYNTSIM